MTYRFSWSGMRKAAAAYLIALSICVGSASDGFAEFLPGKNVRQEREQYIPGEIVLKTALKWSSELEIKRSISKVLERVLGKDSVQSISSLKTDDLIFLVKISKEWEMNQAIEVLSRDPSVEYAEPNYLYHTLEQDFPFEPVSPSEPEFPNDQDFPRLWGMRNTGQLDNLNRKGIPGADIGILPLWMNGVIGDRKIVVAVIDTGVDWKHPDLINNLFTNSKEIPDNGIDDDQNGFTDDVHGWNFYGKNNNSTDDNKHGTHCAGIIGAEGNNQIGVAGINWQVSLLPIKFLSASGSGSLAGAIEAINYARMMKVQVMSNSWGGSSNSKALQDAVAAARDAGILFVAAAGNEGNDNEKEPSYPASFDLDNVVSVAATDNSDRLASFSNYSGRVVHVAAPGVGIYSTVKGGEYAALSGTSMATPHVAGIAALVLSKHPDLSYSSIKDRLISTSTPVQGLRNKVLANGRVNAYNAYHFIVPPAGTVPDDSLWKDVDQVIESPHPYKNKDNLTYEVKSPGAKFLRVFFEQVDTEAKYDFVTVESPSGEVLDTISGKVQNYLSNYIIGDTILIRLKSDHVVTGWGFKMSKIQVIQ